MTTTAPAKGEHQVFVDRANEHDLQFALFGARGIFETLIWIQEGYLDECVPKQRLIEARDNLMLAGRTLAELTLDRI